MERSSGILLPISSLPGPFGIGDFGQAAYDFVDFLKKNQQSYWQILPLTTTGYGDSPYQSFSAVAGNTHFIDLMALCEAGYLAEQEVFDCDFGSDPECIDYGLIDRNRRPLLEKAVTAFLAQDDNRLKLKVFVNQNDWLLDFADFMAIKEHFGRKALQEWDDSALIRREQKTLEHYREQLAAKRDYHLVTQYFFFEQWQRLKAYANNQGIAIIGDIPIYLAADSVEVWTQPELFKLDSNRSPLYQAGVPADDFSATGQLWGNPVYDWDYHQKTGFSWWIRRIKESLKLYDYLRIDHFKGFSDFWQVPKGATTALKGEWVSAPGLELFAKIKQDLGDLPIIAENLGYIDDKAEQLLRATGFPGMKILIFGFDDTKATSTDLPHAYTANSVAYTGTHDNQVVTAWYDDLTKEQKAFADAYLHRQPTEKITQSMIRSLYASVSQLVIIPMQDILQKGGYSRMNTPNTLGGNWQWRLLAKDLPKEPLPWLTHLTHLYNRQPKTKGNFKQ